MLWYVTVVNLDGDYAVLHRTDAPAGETYLVARALLPEETAPGMTLRCENFAYSIEE